METNDLRERIAEAVRAVRATVPLAGSVTNGVTMDFVANAQLAAGGSAAMVYLPDEGEDLVAMGGAFYVNMGTLMPVYEQTIPAVTARAAQLGKPWVLDPVGIGIGSLRAQLLREVRDEPPAIIRGNASEAIALAGLWGLLGDEAELARVRGVDATDEVGAAADAAMVLAQHTGGAVAVSGAEDLITDGRSVAFVGGGSPLMGKVTGFGCSLGGVMAVYAACADPFTAAVAAAAHYGLAGMRAAERAVGPASFKAAFIDALYAAAPEDIASVPLRLQEVMA